jgi:hypothetical protein
MSTPMSHRLFAQTASVLTRRAFVKSFAFAGTAFAVLPSALHAALHAPGQSAAAMRQPVVSFYMDRLYLDPTGTAIPYLSPLGMRSGAPLAHLSEEAFRRAQLYV